VIVRLFIIGVLNDEHTTTATLVVVRDVWPISFGHWQYWSMRL